MNRVSNDLSPSFGDETHIVAVDVEEAGEEDGGDDVEYLEDLVVAIAKRSD